MKRIAKLESEAFRNGSIQFKCYVKSRLFGTYYLRHSKTYIRPFRLSAMGYICSGNKWSDCEKAVFKWRDRYFVVQDKINEI